MKKLLFIFNPHSGKGQIKLCLIDILNIFTESGYDVTIRPTQSPLDAYEYVKQHGNEYSRIVASGGDGTLNECVKGLMTFDKSERIPLGYIPAGTTNDFAATLNIPKNMLDAAKLAATGIPFQCDIGSFNGVSFNYVAAFGAFTDVSYDTPQEIKNIMGHAAYVWESIKRLSSLSSYNVKIKYDGGEIDDEIFLCLILNSTSIGGVLNTEKLVNVDLCDGLFEAIIFRQPTNLLQLQSVLTDIMKGSNEADGYIIIRSSHFEFISDENIKWTLDGEYGGEEKHSVIDVIPSAITYITSGK